VHGEAGALFLHLRRKGEGGRRETTVTFPDIKGLGKRGSYYSLPLKREKPALFFPLPQDQRGRKGGGKASSTFLFQGDWKGWKKKRIFAFFPLYQGSLAKKKKEKENWPL